MLFVIAMEIAHQIGAIKDMLAESVEQPYAEFDSVLGFESEDPTHFSKIDAIITRIGAMFLIAHFRIGQQGKNGVDNALFGEIVNLAASIKYLKSNLGAGRLNDLLDEPGKIPDMAIWTPGVRIENQQLSSQSQIAGELIDREIKTHAGSGEGVANRKIVGVVHFSCWLADAARRHLDFA